MEEHVRHDPNSNVQFIFEELDILGTLKHLKSHVKHHELFCMPHLVFVRPLQSL